MRRSTTSKKLKRKSIPCTIVGDREVGKSWLSMAFTQKCFPICSQYNETFLEPLSGFITVSERQYKLRVLDTSGNHQYQKMHETCYKNSNVILVCFSVVNRTSFNNVKDFWLPEIRKALGKKEKPIVLVGCKKDLRYYGSEKFKNLVTYEEGNTLAKECSMDFYLECAAMSLVGVRDIFENVAWSVLKAKSSKVSIIKGLRKLKTLMSCTGSQN